MALPLCYLRASQLERPILEPFWQVISEHNVRSYFTASTAFRAIKSQYPDGKYKKRYDLNCLNVLYLTGEDCDLTGRRVHSDLIDRFTWVIDS